MTAARVAELQRQIAEASAELIDLLSAGEAPPANELAAAPYLSIEDFAKRLRTSPRTVRRMIAEGLPVTRPRPRTVRVDVVAADRWIARRTLTEHAAPLDAPASSVR